MQPLGTRYVLAMVPSFRARAHYHGCCKPLGLLWYNTKLDQLMYLHDMKSFISKSLYRTKRLSCARKCVELFT